MVHSQGNLAALALDSIDRLSSPTIGVPLVRTINFCNWRDYSVERDQDYYDVYQSPLVERYATREMSELFSANTTDLESDVDMLTHRLIDQYSNDTFPDDMPYFPFIEQGQLPVLWIKYYSQSIRHYNQVIKGMRRQRLLVGVTDRIQVDGKRLFCLTMTDKLVQMLGTPNKPKVVGVVSDVAGNLFNQWA